VSWNSVSPDGTKSVKLNRTLLQDNTTYTETTLNNDHYWNIGVDEDGHHKYAQMPKSDIGGVPTDPTLATGMDSVFYSKLVTDVQPFMRNASMIMPLLGIRAMGVFTVNQGTGAVTTNFSHNVSSIILDTAIDGAYIAGFTNAMPSVNYLILGGGIIYNSSFTQPLIFSTQGNTTLGAVKNTTFFKFSTLNKSFALVKPLQAWFVCFGG